MKYRPMHGSCLGILWVRRVSRCVNFMFYVSTLLQKHQYHYNDVIMSLTAPQINSLMIVYSTVYSDADQRKHQSSTSLAFVRGIHRGPVNSPHKGPVTRKMFPFDDIITKIFVLIDLTYVTIFHRASSSSLQWHNNGRHGVSKLPASPFFTKPFVQAQIKENIKGNWAFWAEFTGDRWIPLTKSSNAENVSIWRRLHVSQRALNIVTQDLTLKWFCFLWIMIWLARNLVFVS